MRILVITDLYPPLFKGGYEIACQIASDGLVKRGHKVRILTTDYNVSRKEREDNIYRDFNYDFGRQKSFLKNMYLVIRNIALLKKHLKEFNPDIVSIWHPIFLSKTLLVYLDALNIPKVYNVEDHWLINWYYCKKWDWLDRFKAEQNGVKKYVKVVLKTLLEGFLPTKIRQLDLSNAWFVSHSLKKDHIEAGMLVKNAEVIFNGIALDENLVFGKNKTNRNRLLWAGRIVEHKGTHAAIEAIGILVNRYEYKKVRLSIAGELEDAVYAKRLKEMVERYHLADYVEFCGKIPHDEMKRIYSENDIFLFTSIFNEPFGFTWLEAFANGVPVVGTAAGATREIFIDGENAVVVESENAEALAKGLKRLLEDEQLYYKIRNKAFIIAKEKFDMLNMIERIEKLYLRAVAEYEVGE